ncbi:DUF4142 domain-containing protein [Anaeromyxobacter terrae]|uniref:DUF4142 domain-containing protein n=1 Tax=Anaeromyxobacter terrae TaxID=2925406 RepID=UPI001F589CA3|nr:DUF4142 domain-containing protein [Anaeromyxobacter sp. SG22]
MRISGWSHAGVCAALLLAAGGARAQASAPRQAERTDRIFLERALGVNELELRLGRLASERAASPDVKAMGEKMIENHGALKRRLAELARAAGASGDATLTAEQQQTFARVEAQTGAAFDDAFRKTVDAGHVGELAMYRDEVTRAASPQLRAFAEERVGKLEQAVAKQQQPASAMSQER